MKISITKLLSIFLIIIIGSSGFVPILGNVLQTDTKIISQSVSNSNVSPLLVTFGNSQAELVAKSQLVLNFPNSEIVDFNSKHEILSFYGPIIFIGHSSEVGIMNSGELIEWTSIAELISSSKSDSYYILGCNSQTISYLTEYSGKEVYSFDTDIDALIGVGIISAQISSSFSDNMLALDFFIQAFLRLNILQANPELELPMRFGGEEVNTIGIIGLAIIGITFPLVSVALGTALTAAAVIMTLMGILADVVNTIEGIIDIINGGNVDWYGLLGSFSKLLIQLILMIGGIIAGVSWFLQANLYALFTIDVSKNAVATTAVLLLMGIALGVLFTTLIMFSIDVLDYDLIYW